ncbi:hypothetical protein KABACHOK_00220 [Brevundimonas phage vB_BpoS-Kabachok]|uniref:Uncharacterized protein n=1 Tax=Brevundimonas phage vB_BpoS-Kabachok TaxID=2948600 RepID=A0A9E7MPB0_9CAUD|nr:hypothetical protein KABACHOK_00220 [Brevundimonas phage vB_BpoS-Kabachok]
MVPSLPPHLPAPKPYCAYVINHDGVWWIHSGYGTARPLTASEVAAGGLTC